MHKVSRWSMVEGLPCEWVWVNTGDLVWLVGPCGRGSSHLSLGLRPQLLTFSSLRPTALRSSCYPLGHRMVAMLPSLAARRPSPHVGYHITFFPHCSFHYPLPHSLLIYSTPPVIFLTLHTTHVTFARSPNTGTVAMARSSPLDKDAPSTRSRSSAAPSRPSKAKKVAVESARVSPNGRRR